MRTLTRTVVAGTLSLALAGCVSLLPKTKPVQLLRFGGSASASAAASQTAPNATFGVLKSPTGFVRAAAGDQILTVSPGGKAAYIGDARWVSPAAILFDEALERAFDAKSGPARLISHGEAGKAELTLKLDVRAFEVDYTRGPKSIPTVKVEVRALMSQNRDRTVISDQLFAVSVPAGDDRVGAIAEAFDSATAQALGQVIAAVNNARAAAAR